MNEVRQRVSDASQEVLEKVRDRWEDLKNRAEGAAEQAGRSLKRELSEDADYVKIRARYYHVHRPLQVLSTVAVAGFALGLWLGLWRR